MVVFVLNLPEVDTALLWASDSSASVSLSLCLFVRLADALDGNQPHTFAQGLARDLRLPDDAATTISKSLVKQIAQYRSVWERKRAQLAASPSPGPQLKVFELEVPLDKMLLRDCFEW